jgi:hypothetical protein
MAFFPRSAKVFIGAASAVSSVCKEFTAGVSNFEQGGAEQESESIKVFGGGNIQRKSSKNKVTVSFDFIIRNEDATLFDQLIAGSTLDGSSNVSYSANSTDKVIYVETTGDDGTTIMTRAYNNVNPESITVSMDADDGYMQGTVEFGLPPTTSTGATNVKIHKAAASTITWS